MMSHRGKRQALSRLDDITPGKWFLSYHMCSNIAGLNLSFANSVLRAVATKRRKGRASATAEEEEASPLEQRPYSSVSHTSSDMKMSSIYNRSVTDAPAEVYNFKFVKLKVPKSPQLRRFFFFYWSNNKLSTFWLKLLYTSLLWKVIISKWKY